MEPDSPLSIEELEEIRRDLLQRIAQAELIFPGQQDSQAMRTSKAALQSIEKLIAALQRQEVA